MDSLLAEIRRSALKELVAHTGLSSGQYQRLGDRFARDRLRQAWLCLTAAGGGRELLEVAGNQRTEDGALSMDMDGAMLACLAHKLAGGNLGVRKLWLQVSSPCAKGLDAITAGLVLLARALPQSDVSHLGVHIVASPTDKEAGDTLFKIQKVRQAILVSLERCSTLRLLHWQLPQVPSDWITEQEEDRVLQRTIFEAKTAMLMALHPRMVGRCRLLGGIPLDCLRTVFEKAFAGGSLKVDYKLTSRFDASPFSIAYQSCWFES